MTTRDHEHDPVFDLAAVETIAAGLLEVGWVVLEDALDPAAVKSLRDNLFRDHTEAFACAGVGRGDDWQRADNVRTDLVQWLDPDGGASQWCLRWFDSLRSGLNRSLILGLFDYECHLAWYRPGAFYDTHVDAFRGEDNRKVSTVLYLNEQWQQGDGGELVLYEPVDAAANFDPEVRRSIARTVKPTSGTLVCFLSEEVPHEVLTARTDRYSIAGWYRVKGRRSDPPVGSARR